MPGKERDPRQQDHNQKEGLSVLVLLTLYASLHYLFKNSDVTQYIPQTLVALLDKLGL